MSSPPVTCDKILTWTLLFPPPWKHNFGKNSQMFHSLSDTRSEDDPVIKQHSKVWWCWDCLYTLIHNVPRTSAYRPGTLFSIFLHSSLTGSERGGGSCEWCWGEQCVGDESWIIRGYSRRLWGRRGWRWSLSLRARGGNRVGSSGQREWGRLQHAHSILFRTAPHNCRLHFQQPCLLTVVCAETSHN